MKNLTCVCVLVFIQLFKASAELTFSRVTVTRSLQLSCSPQQELGPPAAVVLYHRGAQSQTTVLSMAEGDELRVNPEHRGRLQLCGGLGSPQVNVTINQLTHSDTGLYLWELSYRTEDHPTVTVSAHSTVLLVEAGSSRSCSDHYHPLILTIFSAAAFLLLTLSWLVIEKRVKHFPRPHPVPIYEEMTRKQQRTGTPQNNYEAPSHLEEVHFPVYANPNIRQPQDDYYACPRQLALRV